MPQIIAAAVTAFKFIASVAAFVATSQNVVAAVVRFVALNFAASALQGKPKAGGWRGDSLQVSLDPATPRAWLLGTTATAGSLVTFQTWGNKNEYIILLFAVADHPTQGIVSAWNNGVKVTINGDGSVQDFYADGHHNCWVSYYTGDWNQSADTELVSNSGGRWTASDRGRGVSYVKVKARYNEKAFPSGLSTLFQFVWEIQGAKLYDMRLDGSVGGTGAHRANDAATWAYSTNAAVIVDNFLRGVSVEDTSAPIASRTRDRFMGLQLSSDIPFAENVAAMNSCDETVTLKAGGTEPRYRVSGIVTADLDPQTALSDLLAAQAGKLTTAPGRWYQLPGVTQSTVRTLTDDDLRIDGPLVYQQDFPLDELINAVYGRFADPTNIYQGINLPPRLSSTDETADGGRKSESFDLPRVTSNTQGQRVQEIHRRRNRRQRRLQIGLAPEHIDLEAGDWIGFNSTRFGWNLKFEIVQAQLRLDDNQFLMVVVDLREIDSGVYGWTASTDELSPTVASNLPSALFTGSTATGVSVVAGTITSGNSTIPALQLTMDAPTDPIAIGVQIEYRVQGLPSGANQTLTRYVDVNPAAYTAGNQISFTWSDGIVGGYIYEARANVVTRPPRDPVWSSWAVTAAATGLIGNSNINNSVLQSALASGTFVPSVAASITGQSAWATYGGLTPTQLVNKPVNLLYNPTGRLGNQGWTTYGQPFTTVLGQTGEGYFFNCTSGTQVGGAGAYQDLPCQPGVAISISGLVYAGGLTATTGAAYARIYIIWLNSSKAVISSTSAPGVAAGTSSWTAVQIANQVAPAGTAYARVTIDIYGTGNWTNTNCAGRQIKIEPNSVCTPYSDDATYGAAYQGGTLIDSLKPAQANADVTGSNTAAAIVGQGVLATLNQANTAQIVNNAVTNSVSFFASNTLTYGSFSDPASDTLFTASITLTATAVVNIWALCRFGDGGGHAATDHSCHLYIGVDGTANYIDQAIIANPNAVSTIFTNQLSLTLAAGTHTFTLGAQLRNFDNVQNRSFIVQWLYK